MIFIRYMLIISLCNMFIFTSIIFFMSHLSLIVVGNKIIITMLLYCRQHFWYILDIIFTHVLLYQPLQHKFITKIGSYKSYEYK